MSLVAIRQELDEARAIATTARVSEEVGRQQLARMMDEQLAQTQTLGALRRQVETSNSSTRACHRPAFFQLQQGLFVPPFANPSTGLRTREGMARDIIM